MEVFLANLPSQGSYSSQVLRNQLIPVMEDINISKEAFHCDKPLKKNHGKITFLYEHDGRKFLASHGEIPQRGRKRPLSQLTILGARVLCRLSKNSVDPLTINMLKLQVQKAMDRPPEVRLAAAKKDDLPSFAIRGLRCGYYKYEYQNLVFCPEQHWNDEGIIKFGKKYVVIRRNLFQSTLQECYGSSDHQSIYMPINSIQDIVMSPRGTLTFTLSCVPIFFLDMYSAERERETRLRLQAIDSSHEDIVGTCLIYSVDVDPTDFRREMDRLDAMGIFNITRYHLPTLSYGPSILSGLQGLDQTLSLANRKALLPFPVIFYLQALAWNAYLHPGTIVELADYLIALQKSTPISIDAIKTLFVDIPWPTPEYANTDDFEAAGLIKHLRKKDKEIKAGLHIRDGLSEPGGNLTPIGRVTVTPTRILLHPPELENKNRVLRKFPNHSDYFIRVQFCEENNESLRFLSNQVDSQHIYKRFIDIMLQGIKIAGRTYNFLGWSHSSLRAHSMWFSAPFLDDTGRVQTSKTIIGGLGDFNGIRTPARCAARIGQAFSETPFAVQLDKNNISVEMIPEVKSRLTGCTFSDGVGIISTDALIRVWKDLPFSKQHPTCLQIRFAGSKGMLSLDSTLTGTKFCVRPSMQKFESSEVTNLEICDVAKAMPLCLNRQMIKILEDMGVSDAWFMGLQNKAIKELQHIARSAYNMSYYLKHQGVATSVKLHRLLRKADQLGFNYRTEPFLRRVTEMVIMRDLRLLKHKARIPVPLGITLFGVLDETGFLAEGQVYATYETKAGNKPRRFQPPPGNYERLLVTRSPALHPGDIQKAVNVIPPDGHPLRSLSNCIVFSQNGMRDLPSQLSGGDLDGDIFNVIWDRTVCHDPNLKSFTPAEYARPELTDIGRAVRNEDIAEFFINFIKTDHLGIIAVRHMILADQNSLGTLDPDCIELAELHSTAVDFSKTGIPADLNAIRKKPIKFRPDFLSPSPLATVHDREDLELEKYVIEADDGGEDLDGPSHRYYRSEKILGKLYRAVDEYAIWNEDIRDQRQEPHKKKHAPSEGAKETFLDQLLDWARVECEDMGCTEWEDCEDEAWRIRSAYEDAVRTKMHEYSDNAFKPITEIEVFVGSLVSKTGSQNPRQRDRSIKLHDEFDRIAGWIMDQIRHLSKKRSSDYDGDLFAALRLRLACAHLRGDSWQSGSRKDALQSFPLVAASALLQEMDYVSRRLNDSVDPMSGLFSGLAITQR